MYIKIKNFDFFKVSNLGPLIKLTLPLSVSGLIQSLVFFFETYFAAQINHQALATASIGGWIFYIGMSMISGCIGASSTLIARQFGADEHKKIKNTFQNSMVLALICTLPLFTLFWQTTKLLPYTGQTSEVILLTHDYLHALSWSILPNMLMNICFALFIGLGNVKIVTFFSILDVFSKVLLGYLLIFGSYGITAMGIIGAAYAVSLSELFIALFCIIYIYTQAQYRPYLYPFTLQHPKHAYFELIALGLPIGIMYGLEVAYFAIIMILMGSFGTSITAANQIIWQYIWIIYAIIYGLGQALNTRLGHLIGAQNIIDAQKTYHMALMLCILLMLPCIVICYFFPLKLMALDLDPTLKINQDITNKLPLLFMLAAVFQLFESIRVILFFTLRAFKDTLFSLVASTLACFAVGLPLGLVLEHYTRLASAAYWLGLAIGALCCSILFLWRIQQTKRFKI